MSKILIIGSFNVLSPFFLLSVVADHLSGDHDRFSAIATHPKQINAVRIATSMGGDVQARASV
jgi:hypothetical protein